ncbi:cell division protein FtsQ/DivIB [Novosphingobium rosa]|uniref:cell division protein FtsQ/DivIB n=1 Tax=Novosphingobium rosa TaxID=76978 RepID=UPI000A0747FE|nr:FtsQ-type POTRA domain-containing protein [Novosphingobium rosa]
MSQKLKRGGASARKQASKASNARKVAVARARTGTALDRALALLPFSEAQLHRIFLVTILGCALGLAWLVMVLAGVPAMATQQVASIASQAGFQVRRVEVHGVKHLNELKVYERVLAQRDRAMPLVDLEAVRDDLLQLSWVEDARVSRELPDTLVVDIVERKPGPVLREGDKLTLIDAGGHRLEPIAAGRAKGKLVLSGEGVSDKVGDLTTLLDAAPALRPQVAEAEWVGNRRWNLTFKTNQVLALPEGDKIGADALMAFARLDGTNRLLGGRVVAFDMRSPDRIYMRVPGSSTNGMPDSPLAVAVAAATPEADATSTPSEAKPEASKPAAKPQAESKPKTTPHHETAEHVGVIRNALAHVGGADHAVKHEAVKHEAHKPAPEHKATPAHKPDHKPAAAHKPAPAHKPEKHKTEPAHKAPAHKPAAHKPAAAHKPDHKAPHHKDAH